MSTFKWISMVVFILSQAATAQAEEAKNMQKTLLKCDGKEYAVFIENKIGEAGASQRLIMFCEAKTAESINVKPGTTEVSGDTAACEANLETEANQKCVAALKTKAEINEENGTIGKPAVITQIARSKEGLKTTNSEGNGEALIPRVDLNNNSATNGDADDQDSTNQGNTGQGATNSDSEGQEDQDKGGTDKGEAQTQTEGENQSKKEGEAPAQNQSEPTKNEKTEKCRKLESEPFKCVKGHGENKTETLYEAVACVAKHREYVGRRNGYEYFEEYEVEIPMFCSKTIFDDPNKTVDDCRSESTHETLRCREQYLYGPEPDWTQEHIEENKADHFIDRYYPGGYQWHGDGY